jgi:hypothetical protein
MTRFPKTPLHAIYKSIRANLGRPTKKKNAEIALTLSWHHRHAPARRNRSASQVIYDLHAMKKLIFLEPLVASALSLSLSRCSFKASV